MLGGTAVRLCVPSLLESDYIQCTFGDSTSSTGVYLSSREVLCVSPRFSEPGPVALQVTITRDGETTFEREKMFTACELKTFPY